MDAGATLVGRHDAQQCWSDFPYRSASRYTLKFASKSVNSRCCWTYSRTHLERGIVEIRVVQETANESAHDGSGNTEETVVNSESRPAGHA